MSKLKNLSKFNAWTEKKPYCVKIKAQDYFKKTSNLNHPYASACDSDCGSACGSSCDCAGSCS